MAGPIEKTIIHKIRRKFGNKFNVLIREKDKRLPKSGMEKPFYQPDVLLRNKKTNEIMYILEVETDPVRKALVGSAITADFCLGIDNQKQKPRLFYIIGKKGIKQLNNFQFRIQIIEKYIKRIAKPILIDCEEKILREIK